MARLTAHIEERLEKAQSDALEEIRAIQDTCPHEHVIEEPGKSDSFGWRHARRICVDCGVEEVNRYHSWPGETTDGGFYECLRPAGRKTILNTEFVKRGGVVEHRVRI